MGEFFWISYSKDKLNGARIDDEVHVIAVKKSDALKKSFGLLKGWNMSGQKAKDNSRKELYND